MKLTEEEQTSRASSLDEREIQQKEIDDALSKRRADLDQMEVELNANKDRLSEQTSLLEEMQALHEETIVSLNDHEGRLQKEKEDNVKAWDQLAALENKVKTEQ